jgi:phosphate transport system ATP-binding protein
VKLPTLRFRAKSVDDTVEAESRDSTPTQHDESDHDESHLGSLGDAEVPAPAEDTPTTEFEAIPDDSTVASEPEPTIALGGFLVPNYPPEPATVGLTTSWTRLLPRSPFRDRADTEPMTPDDIRQDLFGETTAGELVADSITAWFGEKKVLDRVSLTMTTGNVTALIGPSGCGKSTFLRILNRMHEMVPTAKLAGEIRLDGDDIYAPSERITAARRHIGMIFQKPNPFPAMSIYDNVISGLKLSGVHATRAQKDILVEDSLRKAALWDEVKDRLEQPGGGLSGGQQQRLCIARSLAVSPRVLLMDEPCSALDPTSTRRVEETIQSLRGQVTVVIVTHNMQQAARISDECAFFLAAQNTPGVIVEHGPTDAMFGSPQDQRTRDYVNGQFG